MKKVPPEASPSPQEDNSGELGYLRKHHYLAAFYDDDGDCAPVKKKNSQPQQQNRIEDAGTTAKGHVRQFAKHNYHDHANDEATSPFEPNPSSAVSTLLTPMRGGVIAPFPIRLHHMLEAADTEGMTDAVSWQPHGRAFLVQDPKRFVRHIMPRFFRQHKYSSFQRQLNLYGFMRLTKKGPDHGGYYHELFLRDRLHLCSSMQRVRVKGTLVRTSSSPQTEPDFYTMPFVERLRGDGMLVLDSLVSKCDNFVPHSRSDDADELQCSGSTPVFQPLQRSYPVYSNHYVFPSVAVIPQHEERRGSALCRRLGMNRTPSEEADLARFLEEVDLYASDVETTAAV